MEKLIDPLFDKEVTASSLSRIYSKIGTGECGCISASRGAYTKKQNQEKTKLLKLKLARPGLSITPIKGVYIENYNTKDAVEVFESSFFVHALPSFKGNLKDILIKLGKLFDQDSVFWISKDGKEGQLIGTNNTGYPGLGNVQKYGPSTFGKNNKFMSKVNNRPFYFKDAASIDYTPSVSSMQGVLAELKKLGEDHD